jgi:hypothetical protein
MQGRKKKLERQGRKERVERQSRRENEQGVLRKIKPNFYHDIRCNSNI